MTEPADEPTTWVAAVQKWPWLSTTATLVRRFREDRLALVAGSLTFTTIISLVPLMTVTLALFSAFPMFATLQGSLQSYFVQALVPDSIARPVMMAITQFSSRASRLGAVGLVALVVSSLAMMLTIDRALNAIWRVRKPRRIAQKVLVDWAALTLGPILLAVSLAATSYAVIGIARRFRRHAARLRRGRRAGRVRVRGGRRRGLFHYVPNTRCAGAMRSAAASSWRSASSSSSAPLTCYIGAVPTYSMIYGAFATLPIFLVWIYPSWIIVLLGAVVAAYAPLVGKQLSRWPDEPGSQFHLAVVVIGKLDAARSTEHRGLQLIELVDALDIDPLQIEPVLMALCELDWVGRLEEPRDARYVLLCDPETTPAEPLVAKLLLDPAPDLESIWQRAGFARMKLAEVIGPTAAAV